MRKATTQRLERALTKRLESRGVRGSVVIPTMGMANEHLRPLLEMYERHPLVAEILVINNSGTDLGLTGHKVREVYRGENLLVNPSWNLGVEQASCEFVIISNDDLGISSGLVTFGLAVLQGPFGIAGPHTSGMRRNDDSVPWALPAYERTPGFGTLMMMRRSNYTPIPDDLRIFAGDDFLFGSQRRRNVWLGGFALRTPMGVTSRQPQFEAIKQLDVDAFNASYRFEMGYYERFAAEVQLVNRLRGLGRRLRSR